MKNIVIHKWRGYRNEKYFRTYGYISIVDGDVFDMFDRASKKVDELL
jgi:hypothetical protein